MVAYCICNAPDPRSAVIVTSPAAHCGRRTGRATGDDDGVLGADVVTCVRGVDGAVDRVGGTDRDGGAVNERTAVLAGAVDAAVGAVPEPDGVGPTDAARLALGALDVHAATRTVAATAKQATGSTRAAGIRFTRPRCA